MPRWITLTSSQTGIRGAAISLHHIHRRHRHPSRWQSALHSQRRGAKDGGTEREQRLVQHPIMNELPNTLAVHSHCKTHLPYLPSSVCIGRIGGVHVRHAGILQMNTYVMYISMNITRFSLHIHRYITAPHRDSVRPSFRRCLYLHDRHSCSSLEAQARTLSETPVESASKLRRGAQYNVMYGLLLFFATTSPGSKSAHARPFRVFSTQALIACPKSVQNQPNVSRTWTETGQNST